MSYDKMGIDSVSFNPVNNVEGTYLMPSANELNYNIQKVCDLYLSALAEGKETIRVDNLKRYLGILFHPKSTSSCIQCGAGPSNPLLAIDIHGSIYPCDYFWGNKDFKIGNILEMSFDEAASSKKNFRNAREIEDIENCIACDWKRFCSGGCPGSYMDSKKDSTKKSSLNCEYNFSMLNYVAEKIPFIYSENLVQRILG